MTIASPPLPKPCYSALVRGFEGSEYRPLSEDYDLQVARFSIAQIKARDAQWMERITALAARYHFIRRHSYVLRVFGNDTHGELIQPAPGYLPDALFDVEIDRLRAALEKTND